MSDTKPEQKRRGRPLIDKEAVARERRRVVLLSGMTACYEVIDMARKQLAELDAADKAARSAQEHS